jgi:hypothetical protein
VDFQPLQKRFNVENCMLGEIGIRSKGQKGMETSPVLINKNSSDNNIPGICSQYSSLTCRYKSV